MLYFTSIRLGLLPFELNCGSPTHLSSELYIIGELNVPLIRRLLLLTISLALPHFLVVSFLNIMLAGEIRSSRLFAHSQRVLTTFVC